MNEELKNTIITTLEDLLEKLEVSASISVSTEGERPEATIETEEPGILIGFHGRTLESLQFLVNQMLYKKTGVWHHLTVSVGDYRERRQQQLEELAASAASRVLSTGESVYLTNLTPAERRVVHLSLENHEGVTSESEGEGRDRKLVVKSKSA